MAAAAALGPLPSPLTLAQRASFILKFCFISLVRELILFIFNRQRSAESARKTRMYAERLGGMWITLVKLSSLRGDLLGVEFCRELARTRDRTYPAPFDEIRGLVDKEMRSVGTSFDEVFSEFQESPLAIRSYAQIHRARLRKNGREVVVHVRAPGAVQRAKMDWNYMSTLLRFVTYLNLEPHLRLNDLMFEVKKATDDLLDFRTEVEELRRIGRVLRRRRIYVPVVYRRYCTEAILVLEYISGVSVSDLIRCTNEDPVRVTEWMRENKIDRRRVWRRLFDAHYELLFENNLFYTELLPSSIMLLKNNRIAFVTLGSIGTLDADLQQKYRQLCRSLTEGDYTKACDTYLMMGPPLPYKEVSGMKNSSTRGLRKWESRTHVKSVPYSQKSLGSAIGVLTRHASEQELPTSWNLARLEAAEHTLCSSLEFFDATRSSIKELKRCDRAAQIRAIKQATTKRIRKRLNAASDVAQLNMQLLENVQHDGDYLRRRLLGAQAKLSKVSAIVGRIVKIIANLTLLALAIETVLYIKEGYRISIPLAERGTLGRILAVVHPHSAGSWILLLIVLFLVGRGLRKVSLHLFAKEVRPGDVV